MKTTTPRGVHRAPRAKPATVEIVDDEPKRRRAKRKSGGKVEGKAPKRRLDRKPRGGNGDATSAPVSGRRRGGFLGSGGMFGGMLRSLRPRLG
jgi:hypothetical protein